MRHTCSTATLAIGSLTAAMCPLARICGLVTATRRPHLLLPSPLPTGFAAITLPTVTTPTDGKHGAAGRLVAPVQT